MLSNGYIVVFYQENVEVLVHFWIVVDQFWQAKDQVNNILSDSVGRSCFTTEDNRYFAFWQVTTFDFKVFMNHIKSVHLLTFVLVETFDLSIDDWVFIQLDTFVFFEVTFQGQFIVVLDFS